MTATALSGVLFDPGPHRYTRVGTGRVMTSVTKLLDEVGANGKDKNWFREEHRTRGSRVHHLAKTIALFEHPSSEYEWDETVDYPEVLPYGRAFQRWCREVDFEVLWAETPVWSDAMGLAGIPDLIGYIRARNKRARKLILVDVKSGLVPPSVGLQTAAYKAMAEEVHGIKIEGRYWLKLSADRPEGEFVFRECADPLDFGSLLHFLGVWNWLSQHKKLVEAA